MRSAQYDNVIRRIDIDLGASVDGFVTGGVPVDEDHFPDPGFRAYVLEKIDLNGNGALTGEEMEAVYSIDNWSTAVTVMGNLRGIELFPGLTVIRLSNSGLMELDLSGLTQVRSISLYGTQLMELDLSGQPALESVSVGASPYLESVILGSGDLGTLSLREVPSLAQIDVSGHPRLVKAVTDGERTVADGAVTCAWQEHIGPQQMITGTLTVDEGVQADGAHWVWPDRTGAEFFLPDGTRLPAETLWEVSADGASVTFTASAEYGGIAFTDSRTYLPVCFEGVDEPMRPLLPGEYADRPEDPFRAGSVFLGWFADAAGTEPFDFGVPVTAGCTVHALWYTPEPAGFLRLPAVITGLESEALAAVPAEVPRSVTFIAASAFDGSGIRYVYGFAGTEAETFANAYSLTFLPIDDAWLSAR